MRKDKINKAWRDGAVRIKIGPVTVTKAPADEWGDRKTVVEVDTYFGGREKVADGFFDFDGGNGWWMSGTGTEGTKFFDSISDMFDFFTPKGVHVDEIPIRVKPDGHKEGIIR